VIELFGILRITWNIDEEKQWVDLRATEQSRAEQSRAEQSRAEQSRAEQSRAASYELFDGLKSNT
jgi:hypothetical protein